MSIGRAREVLHAERGLVVRQVRHDRASVRDPVPDRRTRMAHVVGAHHELADLAFSLAGFVELDLGRQAPQGDREEGRRQVAREALPQLVRDPAGTPDVDLDPFLVQRPEEAQALKMVQMEVGQQHVDAGQRLGERRRQPPGDPIQPANRPAFFAARDAMLKEIEATVLAEAATDRGASARLQASRSDLGQGAGGQAGEAGSAAVRADQ